MESTNKKFFNLGRFFGADGQNRLGTMVRVALAIFALLALAYAGTTWLLSQRIERQKQLGSLSITALEFGGQLSEMRRDEKDFFLRKTKDDLDKHKLSYERALESLAKMRNNPDGTDEDVKVAGVLTQATEEYRKAFLAASESQIALGVDENSGLQGALRNKVHAAEDIVLGLGASDLEAGILMLRRHEKDFILREREEYVTKFGKALDVLRQLVAGAKIDAATKRNTDELLVAYAASFREFAVGTFAVSKALVAARTAARAAEGPIPAFVERATARRTVAAAGSARTLLISAAVLAAVLMGLAMLLWSAKNAADAALAERLAGQRKAEAENETLNNSVISILQAVNQLSQRDLTAKAPVTQDIIGTVSDSINALTDETSKVLHGVSRIANLVELASGKVKTQADLVSKTADDERASVGLMIKSLGESTHSANQMAALADQSNTSAEQATQATNTALDTVNGTVKGMESIRETIAETEKRIKRLGERSQEITGIVNLINTISERTHVLALNASMQAAVAGEAGRGFAVVAEEVQRLAESSRNATQQIGTLVNNIQLETNETINTVNRTITQVVQGSEQAQRAGDQMRVTQGITAQLVAQVKRIAEGSNQQKEMSAQLLESVQHIGRSTERTAQQIGAQNQETDSLMLSARRLVESVNVFKLLPQAA